MGEMDDLRAHILIVNKNSKVFGKVDLAGKRISLSTS